MMMSVVCQMTLGKILKDARSSNRFSRGWKIWMIMPFPAIWLSHRKGNAGCRMSRRAWMFPGKKWSQDHRSFLCESILAPASLQQFSCFIIVQYFWKMFFNHLCWFIFHMFHILPYSSIILHPDYFWFILIRCWLFVPRYSKVVNVAEWGRAVHGHLARVLRQLKADPPNRRDGWTWLQIFARGRLARWNLDPCAISALGWTRMD